jgi:hypothetical protein
VALYACRGQVPERGGKMAARIGRGGGRLGMGGFYRARAARRCGGREVVRWSAAADTSMYHLHEWRGVRRRGNRGLGHCQKGKRRRRAHLGGDSAQRGGVCGLPVGGGGCSGGGRGERLGRLDQLGLGYR